MIITQGMGDLGLFDSTDVTQWGVGELIALLAGGYFAISLFDDAKKVGSKTSKKAKGAKRSIGKAATKSTNTIGKVAVAAGIAGAGYLAYQYSQKAGD